MISVSLAPLCGVTDFVFRGICAEQGCQIGYTEMVSAMGYICAPNQRATQELLIRGPKEPHLNVQLFGREPAVVADAANRLEQIHRFDGININMGCPAHKIAPSGEGCGLMRTPEIAYDMMKQTVQAVHLPVSIKMRLGWDEAHINAVEIAQMAEEAGVKEIIVHGRTRTQQYSGKADWEQIQLVAESVRIPVIGNGDLFSAEDAIQHLAKYHVSGIMIGRGAMGNPWIFREINALQRGEAPPEVSVQERIDMILMHYQRMLESRPEPIAIREMRKHVGWYIRGLRGSSRARAAINQANSMEQVMDILAAFKQDASTPE